MSAPDKQIIEKVDPKEQQPQPASTPTVQQSVITNVPPPATNIPKQR